MAENLRALAILPAPELNQMLKKNFQK